MNLVDRIEWNFMDGIIELFGYEWGIRLEDFMVLVTTFLFAVGFVFFVFIPRLFKVFFSYNIRYSNKFRNLVYTFAESHDGYKELIMKRPHSYLERVEFVITFLYISIYKERKPLETKNVRRIRIYLLSIFMILFIFMIIFVVLTINVVQFPEINH